MQIEKSKIQLLNFEKTRKYIDNTVGQAGCGAY